MFDKLEWQRVRRKLSNDAWTKKYEKTKKGFLVRCYRNMLSRVRGISNKRHIYLGMDILDKEDFYLWSKGNPFFDILFDNWKDNKYDRRLTPSIDRIDNDKGYFIENLRWVTFSENCKNTRRNINAKKRK